MVSCAAFLGAAPRGRDQAVAESVITFPGCVNTHAATKQLTVTGLRWVLDDNWRRCFWLRFMPGVYLLVDRRNGLVLIDKPPRLLVAWFGVD